MYENKLGKISSHILRSCVLNDSLDDSLVNDPYFECASTKCAKKSDTGILLAFPVERCEKKKWKWMKCNSYEEVKKLTN